MFFKNKGCFRPLITNNRNNIPVYSFVCHAQFSLTGSCFGFYVKHCFRLHREHYIYLQIFYCDKAMYYFKIFMGTCG